MGGLMTRLRCSQGARLRIKGGTGSWSWVNLPFTLGYATYGTGTTYVAIHLHFIQLLKLDGGNH